MLLFRIIRMRFKQSVRLRLTFYFTAAILPLIAVSLFSIWESQNILRAQTAERTRLTMKSSMTHIDQFMQSVYRLSLIISNDSQMNNLLNEGGNESHKIIAAEHILKQLSNYIMANRFISDVWVLDSQLSMVISVNYGGKRVEYQDKNWYVNTENNPGGFSLLFPSISVSKTAESDSFTVERPGTLTISRMMNANSITPSNNIVGISVNQDTFLKFCKELLAYRKSQLYLIDPVGRIVASTAGGRDIIPFQLPRSGQSYLIEKNTSGQAMLVMRVDSIDSNWSMVLAQPAHALVSDSKRLQMFTYLVIGVSLLLALWISWVVYSSIYSPITELMAGIRQVHKGNLNVQLNHGHCDEFGYLIDAFNRMAMQQKQYIADIFRQRVEKTQTELRLLQSQINPHFLYNTLDSIYASAVNYDAEEICDMVLNLSKFFRLSLNKGRNTFTVAETIEHLNYYIRVQQLRFNDHFTCTFDIPDKCKPLQVLKLILQPLVENAIIHGLEKAKSGGALTISAERGESCLFLQVHNTGRTIPADVLACIREELSRITPLEGHDLEKGKSEFFGLCNVQTRLKLFYGDDAYLRIDSEETSGTTAKVMLPLEACMKKTALQSGCDKITLTSFQRQRQGGWMK